MASGKCPACAAAFGKGARFCKSCGAKFSNPGAPVPLNEAAIDALEDEVKMKDDAAREERADEDTLFPESSDPEGSLAVEVIAGRDKSTKIRPLLGSRLVLGTGADADIRLRDECVSRRHAVLETIDGRLFLHDAGSTNGTFMRVAGPRELLPGDCFVLGGTVLRVVPEE